MKSGEFDNDEKACAFIEIFTNYSNTKDLMLQLIATIESFDCSLI